MYQILEAHFLTLVIIITSVMGTPLYIFGIYVFNGKSSQKAIQIGFVFLLWGALTFWICLIDAQRKLAPLGALIVPILWFLPSLILYWKKNWFLGEKIPQKWLIGYQAFRVIGGVFLIEMMMENVPGIFAYPAGLGDMFVGFVAMGVLLTHRKNNHITKTVIFLVITLGILDFVSAFFFAATSAEGPFQLFYPDIANVVRLFPTGMIPLFLVPCAIFFHTLSLLNYLKFER